ncbi:Uncharacterized protein PBTT_06004 [Plasmodiophora brassicae]
MSWTRRCVPLAGQAAAHMDAWLLENVLACPLAKTPLRVDGNDLVNDGLDVRYAVVDGIPVLVVDADTTRRARGSSQ